MCVINRLSRYTTCATAAPFCRPSLATRSEPLRRVFSRCLAVFKHWKKYQQLTSKTGRNIRQNVTPRIDRTSVAQVSFAHYVVNTRGDRRSDRSPQGSPRVFTTGDRSPRLCKLAPVTAQRLAGICTVLLRCWWRHTVYVENGVRRW